LDALSKRLARLAQLNTPANIPLSYRAYALYHVDDPQRAVSTSKRGTLLFVAVYLGVSAVVFSVFMGVPVFNRSWPRPQPRMQMRFSLHWSRDLSKHLLSRCSYGYLRSNVAVE